MQIPLRLAWAITVHKSQGMSMDAAIMDLSRAFEYGQGYVALSRVRSLAGIHLMGINQRALEVHPEIRDKDKHFRESSHAARERFQTLEPFQLKEMHANFIRAIGGQVGARKPTGGKTEKLNTLEITRGLALQKLSLPDMAQKRGQTIGTILNHLEKLTELGRIVPARDLLHLHPDPDRFAKIERSFKTFFAKARELKLSPVREFLGDSFSFEELRLARLFVDSGEKKS